MLTLEKVLRHSKLPSSSLVCRFGAEPMFFVNRLSGPASQFHLNRLQVRSYLFLPVSWGEARERLERWVEETELRIVNVSLLTRHRESRSSLDSDLQRRRRQSRNLAKKKRQVSEAQPQSKFSLPLPSSNKSHELKKVYQKWKTLRESEYQLWKDKQEKKYRGWKSRREDQYQGWKFRRQAQYQRWKSRRQAQYQKWNAKKSKDFIKRRQVILEEYSKSEWFDSLGRPLTARDSTGRFVNPWQSQSTNGVISVGILLRWKWQRFVREQIDFFSKYVYPTIQSEETNSCTISSPLMSQTIPPLPIPKKSNFQYTWIGHSTCLFQVEKSFSILTDPMFSTRASPFKNFIGVARDVPPAWSIPELTRHHARNAVVDNADERGREEDSEIEKLDICCITHDHYDHMDMESVKELKDHVQLWVVPLGISDWLVESCSIEQERIVELRWWEQLLIGKKQGRIVVLGSDEREDGTSANYDFNNDQEVLTITCCPSSHWAGRTMFDRNKRLWCSFAFSTRSFKFFLCGDSGYPSFPLFRQIGDALGPFDLSCIPIGAYEPEELNKDAHCNPEEAVKIHKDLHSKHSVAIHWGSFQLTEESMGAPPKELEDAIRAEQQSQNASSDVSPVNFTVIGHGETLEKKVEKTNCKEAFVTTAK